ncbi:MAG: ABC transporter substrate-binding protein [Acidobacteriota bacterium]|nr:ABC transporter substrate-binding protein [Acidobacteriota bacterium]
MKFFEGGRLKRAKLAAAAVLTASGTFAVYAAGSAGASAPRLTTIDVGIALSPPKAVFFAPYVAQTMGFFKQEGLKVNLISMPNGLSTELGATSGSINFGLSSATDSVEAAAAGAPIHAIASYGTKLDTECVAMPGFTTAAELKGQPVGTTGAGGFAGTTLAACLKPLGLTLNDVTPIVMTRSQFPGAMASGAIKLAAFHTDDAYVVLHSIPGTQVIDKQYQTLPNWWYGGVASLDSYTAAHPLVTEHFLAALILADNWMNNPKNTNRLITMGTNWSGESRAAVDYAVHFLLRAKSYSTAVNPAMVNWTSQECVTVGDITGPAPTYSQIVNTKYLKVAEQMVAKMKVKG